VNRLVPAVIVCLSIPGLNAQEVPPEAQVQFIRQLLSSTGQSSFACGSNMALKFKLQSLGVSTAANAKIAWASTEAEVKTLKASNCMVVVPKLEWLKLGGSVAIVHENGKPVMYLNLVNVKASGLTLTEALVKTAKTL
jgi:hypothetical protein